MPRDCRNWTKVGTFASDARYMLGGSPGSACVHNNRLLFAGNDYTAGTDQPPVMIFDGLFDRELVRIPTTTAAVIPQTIISMFVANDTIYLSTIDSGSTSSDWAGRVYSLDPLSAVLTQTGDDVFTAGYVPYAFAWHLGRLWMGTNRGDDGTAAGKIYWLRPGIDTTWTLDKTFSAGSITSMQEYAGKLYVGMMNVAATFATVQVRDPADGTYATSLTATGGIATNSNAFLAMNVLSNKLYASYWNADTPKISKVYTYDRTSWTASLSQSGTAARPFMALAVDLTYLFALGGGKDVSPLLWRFNGSAWSDQTDFIDTAFELVPAFGTVTV